MKQVSPTEFYASLCEEARQFVLLDKAFVAVAAHIVADTVETQNLRPLARQLLETIMSEAAVSEEKLDREIDSAAEFARFGLKNYEFWKH